MTKYMVRTKKGWKLRYKKPKNQDYMIVASFFSKNGKRKK